MSKQGGNKKRVNALYYSLAVCVVACFVAAFSIFGSSPAGDATSDIESIKTTEEREVAAPVTDVRDMRDNENTTAPEDISTAATTQASDPATSLDANVPYESDFVLPVSTEISKDYSNGEFVYSEANGDYRVHNGVDFPAKAGTQVVAVISGEVISVTTDDSLGGIVEINHGNKLVARYCGLSDISVEKGDYIAMGETIGNVATVPVEGDTPHIHFETIIDGAYTDPLAVMGKAE